MTAATRSNHQSIVRVIAAIPPGCVASYGQLAKLAGHPRGARRVAWVLRHAPAELGLPWHRVIAASGRISIPHGRPERREQIARLRAEGVTVDGDRVNLQRFAWHPTIDELLWGAEFSAEGEGQGE